MEYTARILIRRIAMHVSRRTFMKVGLFGAVTLAIAGGLARTFKNASPNPFALDEPSRSALSAIAGAMLQGAMPDSGAASDAAVPA